MRPYSQQGKPKLTASPSGLLSLLFPLRLVGSAAASSLLVVSVSCITLPSRSTLELKKPGAEGSVSGGICSNNYGRGQQQLQLPCSGVSCISALDLGAEETRGRGVGVWRNLYTNRW